MERRGGETARAPLSSQQMNPADGANAIVARLPASNGGQQTLIDRAILHRLRNGVCAVGYLMQPLADYSKVFRLAGNFKVVGTGFLVRDDVVITNRHVIDNLEDGARTDNIRDSQWFLIFVLPDSMTAPPRLAIGSTPGVPIVQSPKVRLKGRQARYAYRLRDRRLDVAFIEFHIGDAKNFRDARPVDIDDPRTLQVSEEIAAFGYPHGEALMERDGSVNRWGPVLQQGWISGISPYEGLGTPDEFLLDLRAAEGISGAPVFKPSTGTVCGVLHSGTFDKTRGDAVTTTAFAQPISGALLADWLAEFDLNRPPDNA